VTFQSVVCDKWKRNLITVTGAGGKTSLILALGNVLSETLRVLITTTTHIGCNEIPSGFNITVGRTDFVMKNISLAKSDKGPFFAASRIAAGKYVGFSPWEIDSLFNAGIVDVILVEGDGAKKLPIKGYRSNEPVIPERTTCQLIVVGAEIFVDKLDETNVFRPGLFFSSAGLSADKVLTPTEIVRVLEHPGIFLKSAPQGHDVKRILVINKMDLLEGAAAQENLQEVERRLSKFDEVWKVSLKCGKL
jgi:probable selenium-dependent hydroxylase accessory protein YqeC